LVRDDVAFDEINALIEPLWCGVSIGGCNKPKAVTAAGQRSRLMYVTPAGTSSLAARRLERTQAVLAGRGEWLFHSNELQRSHVQPEPCNLPRSVLTQWVKERNC